MFLSEITEEWHQVVALKEARIALLHESIAEAQKLLAEGHVFAASVLLRTAILQTQPK